MSIPLRGILLLPLIASLCAVHVVAQDPPGTTTAPAELKPEQPKKHWYEILSVRGYAQLRYNRLLETNDKFKNDAGDKTFGENNELSIRRARLVISGQVHPRVFLYFQTDFASTAGTTQNVAQIRDLYADVGLDKKNDFRMRLGISKVPYGYENLQSSRDRLPLDRSDAMNSGVPGERDIGVFLMWSPAKYRELYKSLVNDGLKGSGDYGLVSIGMYNGQGLNRPEANNELHAVARATLPIHMGSQLLGVAAQGYMGNYVVTADQRSAAVAGSKGFSYPDERVALSLALYPKPFGLLAEYNVGRGPEYDPQTDSIATQELSGGFITATYRLKLKEHVLMPFVRVQTFDGARKNELDARAYEISDYEFGMEWQPFKQFELTVEYYIGDHRYSDFAKEDSHQSGNLLRVQAQVNF